MNTTHNGINIMAKSKKPKKKYTPKPVYYPNIVNQLNSFTPFEDALQRLLETGEAEVDDFGSLTYKTSAGVVQSFESTLRVYIQVAELCAKRKNLTTLNLRPLSLLQNRMFERKGFDEEEIEQAKDTLKVTRMLLSRMHTLEIRDILQTVKVSIALDKESEDSLDSNPESRLSTYKRLVGELTYGEVADRNNEYQQLAQEYPEDQRIIETRDLYMKYLSAYNFYNRNKALEALNTNI